MGNKLSVYRTRSGFCGILELKACERQVSRNVWKGCKGYYSDEILKQIGLLPSEQDREKEEVYKGEGIF